MLCMGNATGYAAEAPTDEDFSVARTQFEEVWKTAADASKRQAQLQTNIVGFHSSVEKAKADLQNLAAERRDVALQIAEQRVLIGVLAAQREQVAQSKQRYLTLAQSERERIIAFARFAAVQDMIVTETGPVAGGAIARSMMRSSLGDSIDADLSVVAVARAREQLIAQLLRMADATDAVQVRLQVVARELDDGMRALDAKNVKLGVAMNERTASIDDGWRAVTLSQQELERVQVETAEVTAQVIEMQQSLVRINAQLKESKLNGLQAQLGDVQTKHAALLDQRKMLQAKDDALRDIMDGELRAWKAGQDLRNTDKRQYKKVEDVQRELDDKQARKTEVDAILNGTAPTPAFIDTTVAPPDPKALAAEATVLVGSIEQLKEKLSLLKQGIPEDAADAYLYAKTAAARAKTDRAAIAEQMTALSVQVASLIASSSDISAQIDTVNRESGLDGLPPMFQWPVHGTITAGYYDPDYETVFGVPHKAIDIATPQGTPVKSIAEGVVFKVRLGGATGYTYVLIGHRNGYSSVYGHLSQVYVKAGDIVDYSTIIGLSGGLPGTPGAGPMTTGAHVHVEVLENGAHMNPQAVLH